LRFAQPEGSILSGFVADAAVLDEDDGGDDGDSDYEENALAYSATESVVEMERVHLDMDVESLKEGERK
jgi:hypothetical protein